MRQILATGERLHRSWICKLAHGGHVEYANSLIFKLNQNNPSEGIQESIREDRMNIGDWRAFTSTLDNRYANWHMTAMLDMQIS